VGPLEARPSHTRSLDLHRDLPSRRPRPGAELDPPGTRASRLRAMADQRCFQSTPASYVFKDQHPGNVRRSTLPKDCRRDGHFTVAFPLQRAPSCSCGVSGADHSLEEPASGAHFTSRRAQPKPNPPASQRRFRRPLVKEATFPGTERLMPMRTPERILFSLCNQHETRAHAANDCSSLGSPFLALSFPAITPESTVAGL
jgi:hypothetical protein